MMKFNAGLGWEVSYFVARSGYEMGLLAMKIPCPAMKSFSYQFGYIWLYYSKSGGRFGGFLFVRLFFLRLNPGSAACSLNGYLYMIGGFHARTEDTNKVERYDPAKDEWEAVASLNESRFMPGVAVIEGAIHVFGGANTELREGFWDTIERYDSEANQWLVVANMPSRRCGPCVALRNSNRIKKEKLKDDSCVTSSCIMS